jgi:gas vesicle protein
MVDKKEKTMADQIENTGAFTRGLAFGALLGGVVGAVTALLLAPKTGAELRKDIADKSLDTYNKAQDYMETAGPLVNTAVATTVNEGRERAQTIIDSAKQQAEDLLSSAESVLQDARTKAVTAKDQVNDKIGNVKDAAKAGAEAFRTELKS